MNRIHTICFTFFACLLLSTSASSQEKGNADLQKIRTAHQGKKLSAKGESLSTEKILSLLQDDGSFSDETPQTKHIRGRITQLAIDYKKAKQANKEELRKAIYSSLQYWINHRPKYKFPRVPFETLRAMAAIELVIYNDMIKERESNPAKASTIDTLIQSINEFSHWCWFNGKSPKVFDKHEGHNRGGNVGYRLWGMTAIASCSGNESEMDWVHEIVKEQFPRVVNTPTDFPTGFTTDGSWIQHNAGGAQNYWVGYGVHWINHVLNYAEATKGTPWALTEKEWNTIADYYLDGIQWYHFKNRAALNLAGRHNALKKAPADNGDMKKKITKLMAVSPYTLEREAELKTLLQKQRTTHTATLDSTKYFWNTDLLIHSTPNAYFAIKMLSNRTTGCETSESERAHGKNNFFSGDGSTMIYRNGKEYDKARIGWNWRALPGITALQKSGKLPLSPWGRESKSKNQFAGGLAANKKGIAAFQYNRVNSYANLQANKAYFTYDNVLLALGNSIRKNKDDNFDVWTTLNQSIRNGSIHYNINGKKGKIKEGKSSNLKFKDIKKTSWVYHDGTAYLIFPTKKESSLLLFAEDRTGNWANMDGRYLNANNKEGQLEETSIFQLSLSHGKHPDKADYSYIVIPGIEINRVKEICKENFPHIIQNNVGQQAIQIDANTYMMVFYKKGSVSLKDGISLESDVPVVAMLSLDNQEAILQVSDPLHQQKSGKIKINTGNNILESNIDFPQGINVGKSTEIKLNLK